MFCDRKQTRILAGFWVCCSSCWKKYHCLFLKSMNFIVLPKINWNQLKKWWLKLAVYSGFSYLFTFIFSWMESEKRKSLLLLRFPRLLFFKINKQINKMISLGQMRRSLHLEIDEDTHTINIWQHESGHHGCFSVGGDGGRRIRSPKLVCISHFQADFCCLIFVEITVTLKIVYYLNIYARLEPLVGVGVEVGCRDRPTSVIWRLSTVSINNNDRFYVSRDVFALWTIYLVVIEHNLWTEKSF